VIPLRDDIPPRGIPAVNVLLIALNVFVFLFELTLGDRGLERFLRQAAVVPVAFFWHVRVTPKTLVDSVLDPSLETRIFLSMFLHGGWLHLIGNMLYLWVFGRAVEDRMGHFRYGVFYLLCGWLATYTHILAGPGSKLPSIGASGAIAGVLGAYIALYPRARITTIWPLGIFWPIVELPALVMLGIWFLEQFLFGALSLADTAQTGGVAWWAHVGGFVSGLVLVGLFEDRRRAAPARVRDWDYPAGRAVSYGWPARR
jgi:membrane associated rhomboid family serine protease